MKDDNDLARLLGILAIGIAAEDDEPSGSLPIIAVIKSTGFQKLAKAILAGGVPEGEWPQNPKRSVAEVVKSIQKKLKLGEDAAVLYAHCWRAPSQLRRISVYGTVGKPVNSRRHRRSSLTVNWCLKNARTGPADRSFCRANGRI